MNHIIGEDEYSTTTCVHLNLSFSHRACEVYMTDVLNWHSDEKLFIMIKSTPYISIENSLKSVPIINAMLDSVDHTVEIVIDLANVRMNLQ